MVLPFEYIGVVSRKELPFKEMTDHLLFGVYFIPAEISHVIMLEVRNIFGLSPGFPAYVYGHDTSVAVVDVPNSIFSIGIFRFSIRIYLDLVDQSPCTDDQFRYVFHDVSPILQ